MSVAKVTRISERQNIEYRPDVQNLTNTPSFDVPDSSTITSSLFSRSRASNFFQQRAQDSEGVEA